MGSEVVLLCKRLLEKAELKYGAACVVDCEREINKKTDEIFFMIEATLLGKLNFEEIESLEQIDYFEEDDPQQEEDSPSPEAESLSQNWECAIIDGNLQTLSKMKEVVAYYDARKIKKFEQTKRRYPFLHRATIYRFRQYINRNGNKLAKLKQVEKFVREKFYNTRKVMCQVSGQDLKRWALIKAAEIELDFTASDHWLACFKKRNRIVSRKITKYVTTKELLEKPEIQKQASEFVQTVKKKCEGIPSGSIWNFDQSGFNYEYTCNRSLSIQAEKDTFSRVNSKNAISHSFTVMPLIAMNGNLAPKILVCLQEKSGYLSANIRNKLKLNSNIILYCSKSGKLDKKIMTSWVNEHVSSMIGPGNSALLYDSWGGQTDTRIYEKLPNVLPLQIAPKTTSLIQPLDVYFFRPMKIIRKKVSDRMAQKFPTVNLHARDNAAKMISLSYNQLQSEKFTPMIRHSWFACGYTDQRPGYFLGVNEILFDFSDIECDECECDSFISCSFCSKSLCVSHFLLPIITMK